MQIYADAEKNAPNQKNKFEDNVPTGHDDLVSFCSVGKNAWVKFLEGIGDLHPEICHDTLRVDISTCFAFIIF